MPTNTPHEVEIYVKDVIRGSLPPLNKVDDNILYHPIQDNFPAMDFIIRDARLKKYFGISAKNRGEIWDEEIIQKTFLVRGE